MKHLNHFSWPQGLVLLVAINLLVACSKLEEETSFDTDEVFMADQTREDSPTQTESESESMNSNSGDSTPPVVQLVGEASIQLQGCLTEFQDPGATAQDDVDGELEVEILPENFQIDRQGTYRIHYRAVDSSGNSAEVVRTVQILNSSVFNLNQLMSINENAASLSADYRLCGDIDLSASSSFTPIGPTSQNRFRGSFNGTRAPEEGSFQIRGLVLNRSQPYAGLFGYVHSTSLIRNLDLMDLQVTSTSSYVGGLAGYNEGNIENVHAEGSVSGKEHVGGLIGMSKSSTNQEIKESSFEGIVIGQDGDVGGLVGRLEMDLMDSAVDVNLTGVSQYESLGGLAGFSSKRIEDSSAIVEILGVSPLTQRGNGGLVGHLRGSIKFSSASGSLTLDTSVNNTFPSGGLVGISEGSIENSHAAVDIVGKFSAGGLVGENSGSILLSYAEGNVSATSNTGGLVGYQKNGGSINRSYAEGNVSGNSRVGGLVGWATDEAVDYDIENSYSLGAVSGTSNVGGLIGHNDRASRVRNTYSLSTVSGSGVSVRGLIGQSAGSSAEVKASYWSRTSNPNLPSSSASDEYGQGLFDEDLQDFSTYTNPSGQNWAFGSVWLFSAGHFLRLIGLPNTQLNQLDPL